MTVYAFDGATPWNRSRLKAVKKHGGVAVSVYIVGTPGGMRCAIKGDVDLARSLGLGVLPNWERAADFFRTATLADCRAAGREALAACRALGFPDDGSVGVAFSFDYQVPASGFDRATAQLTACGEGMGGHYRPLGYGQIDLIDYWAAHGLPGPHWLMGSTWRATSEFAAHEVGSPNVALVQSHNAAGNWLSSPVAGTDINTLTQPGRLPAWWPSGSPYAEEAHPLADLTNDQLNQIAHAVWTYDKVPVAGDPKNPTWTPLSVLEYMYKHAKGAHTEAAAAHSAVTSVAGVVNAITPRVAQLQSAVDALSKTVTALEPAKEVALDTAAVAAAAADAVLAKIKGLAWGAKG